MMEDVALADLLKPARLMRAGTESYPILSMTMHSGLVDQSTKFKKRVASANTSQYKVVTRNQLVVGFPIDEGVLSFQSLHDAAIVSPAYEVWDLLDPAAISPAYLERFLRSPRALTYYRAKLRGSTARRRSLPKDIFLGVQVPLPPLPEQRRIAAILDQAEALRAKRRQALARLDALTQSIFMEMFGDPTGASNKWSVETIEEIAAKQKHSIVDGPFGSSMKPSDYVDAGVPVIRITNIRKDGEFSNRDLLFVRSALFDKLRRSSVVADDVLISRVGTIGNTCLFPAGLGDALLSTTGVCKITVDPGKMTPRFLHSAIRLPTFQDQIQKSASTSVQKYFNLSALKSWRIIVPPLDSQREFEARLDQIVNQTELSQSSLKYMNTLFATLQHRAFRGEL